MYYDVIIIGAGAAGFMCAIEAGKRGRSVLLLDHSKKPAEKIRISGGGRCNFTNLHITPNAYLSENPKFCYSALKRYTQHDFISLIQKHQIAYHEKTLGQLFCDESAMQIITMLQNEALDAHVDTKLHTTIHSVEQTEAKQFIIETNRGIYECSSLVIASGGKSIPKMGATNFGYEIAKQFGINIIPTRPGLVPFTFDGNMLDYVRSLAGVSIPIKAKAQKQTFHEAMLFTHRGLSGPAILQISSYWNEKDAISINLIPEQSIETLLLAEQIKNPKQKPHHFLSQLLPKRLALSLCEQPPFNSKLAEISKKNIRLLSNRIHNWAVIPSDTEGYRTAEVTLGGIDTKALSPQTFECKSVSGLFFIGEVVDVTGHLGGFNFQWAWSSGFAAGQYA